MEEIGDIWRMPVRYQRGAREFEVRSAGPDGAFDSDDDIVVTGQLGRTLECAFRTAQGMVTCDEPPPPCPEAPGTDPSSAAPSLPGPVGRYVYLRGSDDQFRAMQRQWYGGEAPVELR